MPEARATPTTTGPSVCCDRPETVTAKPQAPRPPPAPGSSSVASPRPPQRSEDPAADGRAGRRGEGRRLTPAGDRPALLREDRKPAAFRRARGAGTGRTFSPAALPRPAPRRGRSLSVARAPGRCRALCAERTTAAGGRAVCEGAERRRDGQPGWPRAPRSRSRSPAPSRADSARSCRTASRLRGRQRAPLSAARRAAAGASRAAEPRPRPRGLSRSLLESDPRFVLQRPGSFHPGRPRGAPCGWTPRPR